MKTVSATTWIDATPMKVWAILTDLSRYQDWNPLFPEASGEIAVGRRIVLRSVPAGGRPMTIKPTITAATAGTELCWAARLPGILSGEHRLRAQRRERRHAGGAERDLPRGPRPVLRQGPGPRRDEFPGAEPRSQRTSRIPVIALVTSFGNELR